MSEMMENKRMLVNEMNKLQDRYVLSQIKAPDYFEPGMEYMDQVMGIYDEESRIMTLRFESKGTRYEGRTAILENAHEGDSIEVVREPENRFNYNNFKLVDGKDRNMGNMPKELCNVIAPLYDIGEVEFLESYMSFVAPLSKRNRHSKQGMFFVQLQMIVDIPHELLEREYTDSIMAEKETEEMFDFLDNLCL